MTERLLDEDAEAVNDLERKLLVRDIQHEMLGFGPLELLMADPAVSDILVNRHDQIYVERHGKLEPLVGNRVRRGPSSIAPPARSRYSVQQRRLHLGDTR